MGPGRRHGEPQPQSERPGEGQPAGAQFPDVACLPRSADGCGKRMTNLQILASLRGRDLARGNCRKDTPRGTGLPPAWVCIVTFITTLLFVITIAVVIITIIVIAVIIITIIVVAVAVGTGLVDVTRLRCEVSSAAHQ
ncbi:hypothetical protein AAFF_G00294430 [Aldrovandia affinis]|uniref:Transmembrane protein n=1 Tax=Aldrovandia affinis TaxID=143900 RepID=A0AAD7R943_9TELE|nr:hypothetical protein AAFF_G00294430 [Aldrovandia affinis]